MSGTSVKIGWRRDIRPGLLLLAWSVLCAGGASAAQEAAEPVAPAKTMEENAGVAPLTAQLLKQIASSPADQIWEPVGRLVRLGRTHGTVVTDPLETALQGNDQKIKLAASRALCQLNLTEDAVPAMVSLLQNGSTPEIRRLTANAIGLTTSLYGDEAASNALAAALSEEKDDLTRISIARSLWRISAQGAGRDELQHLLAVSPDKNVRDEAALVLAENGNLHLPEVRARLLALYTEPTVQGERAFNLLRRFEEDAGRNRDPKQIQGERLIRELVRTVKTAYPDESKTNLDKLFENAAKGMIGGLDPFSQYMDREEVKSTQELLQQDYSGIGAYVSQRNNQFIIQSPIYGSPADKAGLRALDVIQEVDGVKTSELLDNGGMNGVIARLKGPPGTAVKIKYYRRGFLKPVEISVVRDKIRVESVLALMLPGNIGYVRLTRFGEKSADEMQAALDLLLKQQQARGLVLDLRDNPGGLLRAGVEIADKFLAARKLIVYSEGNRDFAPRKDYYSSGGGEDEAFPMAVLVNAGSASASEIVAGAMQDHKRAVLVGEKTFGKGSVQQIMPLQASDKQTQLRLTIAKYYLPSGRCIHEKGVDADIEVKLPELHGWVVEQVLELRRQGVFEDFLQNRYKQNKELYAKLAHNDGGDPENWPGFKEFYQGLKTRLEPADVRFELRSIIRRWVQDDQKKELIADLQEDEVLQRGVFELLKKLNLNPEAFQEYKTFPEKFKKKDAAAPGALLPGDSKPKN